MLPAEEALDRVGEAGTPFGEVGRVDLREVAEAHDLRARARAGDERPHFLGREVLRFVDEDEFLLEGAPAHEGHALDLQALLEDAARRLRLPGLHALRSREDVEVVVDGAHPGDHLFLFRTRKIPDVFAHAHGGARDENLVEAVFVHRHRKGRRQAHEGLAGPRLTENRHEVDVGREKEVEGGVLLDVAGVDAEELVALRRVVLEERHRDLRAFDRGDARRKGRAHVGGNPEDFVQDEVARRGRVEGVGRDAVLFLALERRGDERPEVVRERADAREEQVRVVQDLVGEIVFRGEPQGGRLDAHVHVLRDEDGDVLGEVRGKAAHDGEDAVVPLVGGEFRRQGRRDRRGFEVELSESFGVAEGREVKSFREGPFGVGFEKRVERAREAAAVAGDFGRADLVVVELFERRHRQEDVVFGKAEEAARIVQEHVRVEHEELLAVFAHDGAASAVARGFYDGLSLRRGGKEPIGGGEGFGRFLFGGRRHVDAFGGHRRHGFFVRGGCGSGGNIRGSGLFGLRDGGRGFWRLFALRFLLCRGDGRFLLFFLRALFGGLGGLGFFRRQHHLKG